MSAHEPLPPGYSGAELVLRDSKRSVYRARDDVTSREVALHVVEVADLAHEKRRELAREMAMLQRLRIHPNLVTVHRVITSPDGGSMTIVTDHLGVSTAGLIRRDGSLDVRRAMSIGIKIAGALATCHRAALVHGRVQPDDILLTRANEPCLTDLWMTRVLPVVGGRVLDLPGTPMQCAPEVLEGAPPGAAADVFGLASSLYELVTGRPPNSAGLDDAPTSMASGMRRPATPPLLGPGIPPGLSDLLLAAMANIPTDRPPSAQSFAHELQSIERASGCEITPILVFDVPEASTTITSHPEGWSSDADRGAMTMSSDATFNPNATTAIADRPEGHTDRSEGHTDRPEGHTDRPESNRTEPAKGHPDAAPRVLECTNGHRVERGDRPQRFCRYCGNPLFVRCANGHVVAASARFCRLCGQSLS